MGVELVKIRDGKEEIIYTKEKFGEEEKIEENLEAYNVLKILGRGENNCLTQKVYSIKTNKIYIMKEIKMNLLSEERRKQLIDVLNILKNNECQNIIKHFTFFQENDNLYIINEFAKNGDLRDFLKTYKCLGKNVDEKKLYNIFFQCIESLKYLHSNNIIHRDIRLENFLIADDGFVKLANFKNAILLKDTNEKERFHDQVGGVLYRSPEMNDSNYGKKTDIYSLGVVFHQLLFHDYPDSKIYKKKIKYEQFNFQKNLMDIINPMLGDEKKRPDANKLYQNISIYYIHNAAKNTSIKSIFRCINAYQNFTSDFEEKKNNYQNYDKTPFSNRWIIILELLKKNVTIKSKQMFNILINYLRDLIIETYYKGNDNMQEINPIIVLKCLLENLNRETSDDFNGPSFTNEPNKYNNEEKKIEDIIKGFNEKYNSLIYKYFAGILETKRVCQSCNNNNSYNYSLIPYYEFDLDRCSSKNAKNNTDKKEDVKNWFNTQFGHKSEKHIQCNKCKSPILQESKTFLKWQTNLIVSINRGEDYHNRSKLKYDDIIIGGFIFTLIGLVKRRINEKGEESFISIHFDHSKNTWILSNDNEIKEIDSLSESKKGVIVLLFYLIKGKEKEIEEEEEEEY